VDINDGWSDSGNLIAGDWTDLGEAMIPSTYKVRVASTYKPMSK
jgi:hypothetical protein